MNKKFVGKTGIVVGGLIAILLLYYHSSAMIEQVRQGVTLTSIDISLLLGVIFGGAISGFIIEKYFIRRIGKKGSNIGCIIAGILISPVSFYFGIVSTPFGIALGSIFSSGTMINKFASAGGICISIIVMINVVEVIGAAMGTALGSISERILQDFKHR